MVAESTKPPNLAADATTDYMIPLFPSPGDYPNAKTIIPVTAICFRVWSCLDRPGPAPSPVEHQRRSHHPGAGRRQGPRGGYFLTYARGFLQRYDLSRVIDGFMIQGGGFTGRLPKNPPAHRFRTEADNGLKNLRGTIAMARPPIPTPPPRNSSSTSRQRRPGLQIIHAAGLAMPYLAGHRWHGGCG